MDAGERDGRLERAEALLEEAARELEEAARMTPLDARAREACGRIRAAASSEADACSVRNIRRDMARLGGELPCWTRPFASVKYASRKDI